MTASSLLSYRLPVDWRLWLVLFCGWLCGCQITAPHLTSPAPLQIFVAADGSGEFRTLSAALESLPTRAPDPQQWVLIRLGTGEYREKIFLRRDKVIIAGAGRDRTVIRYPELRLHFLARQQRADAKAQLPKGKALSQDWGAAVVNIQSSDIALLDLTVHNNYAEAFPTDPQRFEHQFAVRGFEQATRILTDHCAFLTAGADTLSLWNKTDGMYFHSHCRFVGRVDMVCPRGTAFIRHSEFYNQQATATLWHDGELAPSQKLVVMYSQFAGVAGFQLGRRHYDGQFYLLHNQFSAHLADQPLYRRTYPEQPERDQPNRYGDRYYFYHNQGPDYPWLQDNLTPETAAAIDADWTFAGRWQPEQQLRQIRHWLATLPAKSNAIEQQGVE